MSQNQEHCRALSTKLKLPVLLFHQQQYKKYVALFNATINNALVLMLVILKVCAFKISNTTMG
jgi:hypothetical protein